MRKAILLGIALGIVLGFSGCGATIAEKAVVKETIIVPKHKAHKHHRHYRGF